MLQLFGNAIWGCVDDSGVHAAPTVLDDFIVQHSRSSVYTTGLTFPYQLYEGDDSVC